PAEALDEAAPDVGEPGKAVLGGQPPQPFELAPRPFLRADRRRPARPPAPQQHGDPGKSDGGQRDDPPPAGGRRRRRAGRFLDAAVTPASTLTGSASHAGGTRSVPPPAATSTGASASGTSPARNGSRR